MNKIFKVIWNPATGSYSVASETAKSRGKKSGRSKLLISALVAGGLLSSFGALANNYDGQPTDYGDGSAGDGWVAIGKGSKANTFINTSGASTALGYDAIAEGMYSSAIGSKTLASGGASMAFGVSARALGDRSVALGASSTATGDRSTAFGRYAKTNGYTSLAVGDTALADGEKTIALGNTAQAYEIMSIALGDHANASKEYSMALGASSAASAANAIAVGRNSAAAGVDSLAFGRKSLASAANAIAMGAESKAAENATAVGTNAEANGLNSIALGSGSIADVDNTIALGNQSQAVAAGAIAIGQGNKADGANAIALGNGSITGGVNAIALGQGSYAGLENGTAIGAQASAQGKNSVALGAGSVATDADTVSVGNTTAQRQIVNMAAGDISTTSTDAINGSQLYAISKSVADNLGGGATVNAQGVVTSPNYRLKSGIFGTVGDALTGLDNNTLQWDSLKKAYSAAHGTDTTSTITNVKDGAISDTSKDAVNGSQLKTTNDNVATNTANITTNTNSINTLTDSVGDLKDDALLWNGTAFSAAHGTEATSKITNVKDGDLTAGSTDAVNGSQLKTTNDAVAANTTNIATNTTNITNLTDAVDSLGDDSLLWNATAGAFSAAHGTEATSKITNVTAGDLTAGSTDAVNGSQLKTTNDAVAANTTNIATNTTNITNLTDAVDSLGDDSLLWNDAAKAFSAAHGTDATSKITNVKDGDLTAGSTDAVNGSQLKTTNDAVAANTTNIATNTTNITNLTDAVDSLGDDSLLWNATAGAFSAAHGTDATSKITNVKDGDLTAGSTDAVNGSQLKTTNDAVAANTTNIATNTTNITNLTDAVDSLGDDSLLWNATAGAFSAKHGTNGTDSKITNLLAGTVSSDSTDAINGSQLYGLADSFTSYLGGGADISDAGVLTGPTYTIGGTDYNNVGDALAAINTSFSTSLGDALLWDATAKGGDGAFSAGRGKDNTASIITNVADGAISSTSSDAINGSQLYDTSKYIADTLGGNAEVNADGTITAPTYAIAGGSYSNVGDALEAIDTTLDDALLWDATANGGNGAFSAGRGVDKTASVITNVADGAISATSSDAINGSQLYTTNKYIADALGGDAEVNADGTITAPSYTIANAEYNNVGDALDALDDNALLWDATANDGAGAYNASHDGKASIITNVADGNIGEGSTDAINGSQLFNTNMLIQQNSEIINQLAGNTSETYIEDNGAGINYVRTNDNGLAFNDASASGIGATAVGYNAVASGESSVAIGQGSSSSVDTGIALGSSSVSSRVIVKGSRDTSVSEEGVVIGYDTTDGELLGALSIGDDGKYRQIINVADGSEAHDAVTVRQLQNAIGAVATTPSKYFHANSTEEDSLAVGEDSLAMGAKTIVNGDAGIGIGLNTLVLTDAINGIAIGSNASANHANSIALGTGSVANEENTISVGSSTNQRRITNVAAGVNATDAVNVSQLKSSEAGGVRYDTKADGSVDYSNITLGGGNGGTTRISNVSAGVNNNDAVNYAQLKQSVQETKQYTDQRMVEMDNKLSKTESKLSGGIASAMAMTGLPQAYTPGASMASIGGGTYNGESAVALGVSMVSANGRWVYKLQGSTNSQGEYSAALGAGIQW
ncbi:YadA-like family protein [Escherichia coli]